VITRRVWAAAQVFAKTIGLPPGGNCPAAEAAWRVILTVRAYEEASELQWRQAQLQAIIAGNSPDGFDAVTRAFRRYRETALPWLGPQREKEEAELRRRFAEFSKHLVSIKPLPGARGRGGRP